MVPANDNYDLIYSTIRDEILDQKKCQFQLFSVSVAITSGILAYAAKAELGVLVYIAPMLINTVTLWMVLEKAISVQRKVGYLQMMERTPKPRVWKWETHLDCFRGCRPPRARRKQETHKHTYVLQVAAFLLSLNTFCTALYFFGPGPRSEDVADGWIGIFCGVVLAVGFILAFMQWRSLVYGHNSTARILETWNHVLETMP